MVDTMDKRYVNSTPASSKTAPVTQTQPQQQKSIMFMFLNWKLPV